MKAKSSPQAWGELEGGCEAKNQPSPNLPQAWGRDHSLRMADQLQIFYPVHSWILDILMDRDGNPGVSDKKELSKVD